MTGIFATFAVGKMRQTRPKLRGTRAANVVPEFILHRGMPRARDLGSCANVWWHMYCLAVFKTHLDPTQRSWMPSRPNSRNTGSQVRDRRRTSESVAGAAMIFCRPRSRKPWRNSPSASTRRAAFTDRPIHPYRSGGLAQRLHRRGRATLRTVRSPLPATFLPAGFFLVVVRAAWPPGRSSVNSAVPRFRPPRRP
jgi:hypothetical protein